MEDTVSWLPHSNNCLCILKHLLNHICVTEASNRPQKPVSRLSAGLDAEPSTIPCITFVKQVLLRLPSPHVSVVSYQHTLRSESVLIAAEPFKVSEVLTESCSHRIMPEKRIRIMGCSYVVELRGKITLANCGFRRRICNLLPFQDQPVSSGWYLHFRRRWH